MKLLFDENIGKPLVLAIAGLASFSDPPVEVKHILEITQACSVPDHVWIPKIASESWLVVSADRGRRGKGMPLPKVCRQFGVSHVLISGALHQQRQFEKARAIFIVWPKLIDAYAGPPGTEYVLQSGPVLRRRS